MLLVTRSGDLCWDTWWPATNFLYFEQIFEILNLKLFLGGVVYEGVCKVILV